MKKVILIISILTIILLLTGCMTNTVTLPPETTASENNTPTPVETIVYDETPVDYEAYSGDEGGIDKPRPYIEDFKINGIPKEFHFCTELALGRTFGMEESHNEAAETTKTVSFANKEWNLKYDHTENNQYEVYNTDVGDFPTRWDVYRDDNGTVEISFDLKTGKLLRFERLVKRNIKTHSLDNERAIEMAAELITSMYGKNTLDGYEVEVNSDNVTKIIYIVYTKYIAGIETDDMKFVRYGFDGVLEYYSAETFGLFNHLKTEVSPKRIEDAKAALLSALPEGTGINESKTSQYLQIDANSGKCFIRLNPVYPTEISKTYPNLFYINVN